MFQFKFDENHVAQCLKKSWSSQSSSKWTSDNPSAGQCSVTAIVLQKYFGGEILKTKVQDQWHYYNCIQGCIYNFTVEQFDEPVTYLNISSSQEEAMTDTNQKQVSWLRNKLKECLS